MIEKFHTLREGNDLLLIVGGITNELETLATIVLSEAIGILLPSIGLVVSLDGDLLRNVTLAVSFGEGRV